MTFFNKKTEVMQIEMTPYGRYLYSIGKFKPHSYEFVDDDVVYKVSNSGEAQESAHTRIIDNTPKLKINRAFQDEAPQIQAPSRIEDMRVMIKKDNQRQNNLYPLGKSSYSSNSSPSFQITMLQGNISNSSITQAASSSVFIPQVNIDYNIDASLKSALNAPVSNSDFVSEVFEDGTYVDLNMEDIFIHMKEFGSFYEKENYEIEVFLSQSTGELKPLKMRYERSSIVDDMMVDFGISDFNPDEGHGIITKDHLNYYFSIEVDDEIPQEDLCKVVDKLEINSQFLDEELICPDQRTDRFDIYATRVGPEDLEDCD